MVSCSAAGDIHVTLRKEIAMIEIAFALMTTLAGAEAAASRPSPPVEMQARRPTPQQARAQCWREAGFDPRASRNNRGAFPMHLQPQIEVCVRRKLGR